MTLQTCATEKFLLVSMEERGPLSVLAEINYDRVDDPKLILAGKSANWTLN